MKKKCNNVLCENGMVSSDIHGRMRKCPMCKGSGKATKKGVK